MTTRGEGQEAYARGDSIGSCPYPEFSTNAKLWTQGWVAADMQKIRARVQRLKTERTKLLAQKKPLPVGSDKRTGKRRKGGRR